MNTDRRGFAPPGGSEPRRLVVLTEVEIRFVMWVLGGISFGLIVWWRRRTRNSGLNLSEGSQRLNKMVEDSDKPDLDEL